MSIFKTKKPMKQQEARISEMISLHIQRKYPNVRFRFDIADMKLTMGQAIRMKRLQGEKSRGWADMFIAHPSKGYHGMFIELKKNKDEVFLKDGITYRKKTVKLKNGSSYDHIQEQVKFIEEMEAKGYRAVFGFGYNDTIEKIKDYLGKI